MSPPLSENSRPEDEHVFGCPRCGGPLIEDPDPAVDSYRCKTGHTYTVAQLTAEQKGVVAKALDVSLRAQMERCQLLKKLAERAHERGHPSAAYLESQFREAEGELEVLMQTIEFLNVSTASVDKT